MNYLFSSIVFTCLFGFFAHSQEPRLVLPIGHTEFVSSAVFSSNGKLVLTASGDKTARIYEVSTGKELQVFNGHTSKVCSAVFSPDDKLALTLSTEDSTARIYEVLSGKELKVLRVNKSCIYSAVFSPDGKLVVTASYDGTSRCSIFEVSTGKELPVLIGGTQAVVQSAVLSSDGKLVLMTSWDRTSRIFDVSTGKELHVLIGHTDEITSLAPAPVFSPDGKLVLMTSRDSTSRIFDVSTGKELHVLIGHTDRITSAVFSPDGKIVLTASWDSTSRIFDVSTGKQLNLIGHTYPIMSAAFSSDGKLALMVDYWGSTHIFDVSTSKELQVLGYFIISAVFSPDGKLVLTTSRDGTSRIFDVSTGKELHVLEGHTDLITSTVLSPDGKLALMVSYGSGTARIFDLSTGKKLQALDGHKNDISSAVFSPDGKLAMTASWDAALIYEVSTGKELQVLIDSTQSLESAVFSPDGKIALAASTYRTSRIFDVSTGKELHVLEGHTHLITSAVFSPDGKIALTASWDSTARIFDVSTGKELHVLEGHTDLITSAVFSPDGKLALTASDSTARIFDVTTGKELQVLNGHTRKLNSAVFSPDGKLALTASDDRTACIYEVSTGKELHVLIGHTDQITSAVFSPDGKIVLTATKDGTARIYEVSTGKELQVLIGHTDRVISAIFSPDSKRVLTTSRDHKTILWDALTGKKLYTRIQLENDDWLVYDEDYHFDGSEGAIDYLYLVCGLEVVDLAQVKDSLYVPGLVSKIMNKVPLMRDGKPVPKLSDLNICNLTPIVEPQEPVISGELRYRIIPRNGGLGNTEVYINGNLTFTYPKNTLTKLSGNSKIECYELVLNIEQLRPYLISSDGAMQNPVVVKAKIENGSIYSRGVTQLLESSESGPLPRFFGVFIGVDEYGNPEKQSGDGRYRNLDYAAKDANDLSNAIEASTSALFDEDQIHIFRLTGKNNFAPTKEAIQQTLDSIGKLANANDVLFIFFAGHGDIKKSAENKNEMCFLTERATIDDKLGFSVAELMEWCKPQNIKAQKRVFVFDACHSGQAVKDFNDLAYGRGEDEDTRILQLTKLKDKNGMMILAASAANEFAYEDPTLRQGVLTYHLLNAIKNNASALSPAQDSLLVIRDWFDEVIKEVTVYAQRNSQVQSPTSFGDGRFYIGKITSELQANIDVKAQKVRIGKSVFVPIDAAMTWCPDLDRRINEKLSSASSAGRGDYVYTEREGYYAKGSYKIQKKKIMVSYALFKGDDMVSEQVVMIKPIPTSTDPAVVADLIKESIEQELFKVVERF